MISLSDLGAAVLLLGMIMYAAFGGADFGGGIWTAFASGPRKKEQRESLFHAIGPVWETNHVWLIFVVVVLFMVFPKGFAYLFIALLAPLVIALVGINFRGAAFAFRHFGRQTGREVPPIARTFSVASLLTPFALGMTVTAAASERIRIVGGEVVSAPWAWITPFTLVGGLVGMAVCALLAPSYMTVRTEGALQDDFRKRGMAAGWTLGVLTLLEIPVAFLSAPHFAAKLFLPPSLACVTLAVAGGLTTQALLLKRKYLPAQIAAAGTVTLVLLGFGATMYPDLILGELSIDAAAAPRETLLVFFAVLPFGAALLAPSLFFLYWTFRGPPNPKTPAG
ncbi:MAG TPA: cytochrome d ubiquinol oxidase subunit II [Desulfuromonadales bacterium]